MTKQEFLSKLRANLSDFSQDEINDILYDYEEHFSIGLENGKTEEEIAEELGSVADIANQYKKERAQKNTSYYNNDSSNANFNYDYKWPNNINTSSESKTTKILITILVLLLCSPIIMGFCGGLIGVLGGCIGGIIFGFFGSIASITLFSSTSSTTFIGILLLTISAILISVCVIILIVYFIKLIIHLCKKGYYYFYKQELYNNIYNKKVKLVPKKSKIAMLILSISFLFLVITGISIVATTGSNFVKDELPQLIEKFDGFEIYNNYRFDTLKIYGDKIDKTVSAPLDGVENLNVSTTISDVEIIVTDSAEDKNKITASLVGEALFARNIDLTSETSNNTILIKQTDTKNNSPIKFLDLSLKIFVPSDFKGSIDINTISGSISSNNENFDLEDLKAKTTSGDINLNDVKCTSSDLLSVSGSININALNCPNNAIKTTSGDIILKSVNGELKCDTVSGEIKINNVKGCANINSVSGDISSSLVSLSKDSKFDSKSGDISLSLDPNLNCQVTMSTLSGNTVNNSPSANLNNASTKIFVSTLSGDVNVN